MGVTSAVGAITHARAGRVRWRIAALFGLAAMAGAYAGGRLARFIPGTALLIAFAVIMIAAAIAAARADVTAAPILSSGCRCSRVLLLGVAVGVTSGLVGAGGGFP